jgi:hypothetical protein
LGAPAASVAELPGDGNEGGEEEGGAHADHNPLSRSVEEFVEVFIGAKLLFIGAKLLSEITWSGDARVDRSSKAQAPKGSSHFGFLRGKFLWSYGNRAAYARTALSGRAAAQTARPPRP